MARGAKTNQRLVSPSGARKLAGQMPSYTPEQISKLRERFEKVSGRKITIEEAESVIDILGLSRHQDNPRLSNPALYSPSNFFDLNGGIKQGERYDQILRPYIEAALAYVREESAFFKRTGLKRLHILGGTAGTGKSTARSSNRSILVDAVKADPELQNLPIEFREADWVDFLVVPAREASVPVDPDEAKQVIPEYDRGIAMGLDGIASTVHEESRAYANELYGAAIANQVPDIVYDTSGQFNGNPRGPRLLPATIEDAVESMYSPAVKYFFSDLSAVGKRLDERKAKTGRDVPRGIVPVMQNNLQQIVPDLFEKLISPDTVNSIGEPLHWLTDFQVWDTTNLDKPVLVLWFNGRSREVITNLTMGPRTFTDSGWARILNAINILQRGGSLQNVHTINSVPS